MRTHARLSVGVVMATAASTALLAGGASPVFAFHHATKPVLTATQASLVVPATPAGAYTLKLWTLPHPSTLVGLTTGTSGTLTLPVPQTPNCRFQVDVRVVPLGGTDMFYSGLIATVPGCGQSGNGQRLTPGFWKTHQTSTQALLPQTLGSDVVTTADQATAIFDAMNCSDAVNCLAGHLLAAELDVANGSSICIVGVIFQANQFLISVGYSGPGSYSITSAQQATAVSLASTLDNYTNDSTSVSC